MSTQSPDRWLLPRRQTEFPLRDLLPEEVLHARREATFLVLAVLAVLPVAVLVLGGVGHVIDLSALLSSLGIESPIALALPVGVVPFAVGLVAVAIVCELFGRRRARALVWVTAVSAIALAGFARLVDVVAGHAVAGDVVAGHAAAGDVVAGHVVAGHVVAGQAAAGGDAFAAALALAAACVAAEIVHVIVFDGLRRAMRGRARFVRMVVAAWVACALGFAALVGVASLEAASGLTIAPDAVANAPDAVAIAPHAMTIAPDAMAIAAGAAAWSCALAVGLAIVAAFVMRGLAVALRLGREMVVQRDAAPPEVMEPRVVAPARPAAAMPTFVPPPPVVQAAPSSLYERSPRGTPAIGLERAPRTTLQGVAKPASERSLPPAEIVDEDVVALEPEAMRQRAPRVSLQPFSSAEMQFFREGDELEPSS